MHIVATRLHDLADLLASVGDRHSPFPLPHGRGNEFHHGGSPDQRDKAPTLANDREIYIPGLHIDTLKMKPRDFRCPSAASWSSHRTGPHTVRSARVHVEHHTATLDGGRETVHFSPIDAFTRGLPMPDYRFNLHDGPTVEPKTETVAAHDDVEARALAEIRLLLSRDFTHVEVFLRDQKRFALARDSGARARRLEASKPTGAPTRRPRPGPDAHPRA